MATQQECKNLTFEERERNFNEYVQNRNTSSEHSTSKEMQQFWDIYALDYDAFVKNIKGRECLK